MIFFFCTITVPKCQTEIRVAQNMTWIEEGFPVRNTSRLFKCNEFTMAQVPAVLMENISVLSILSWRSQKLILCYLILKVITNISSKLYVQAIKAFNVTFQLYFLETTFSTFLLISWPGVGRGFSLFSIAVCVCILLETFMTTALLPCLVSGCFCLMSSRVNVATLENETAELVNQDISYTRAINNLYKGFVKMCARDNSYQHTWL